MARRRETTQTDFGRRMAKLRKEAGYTQQELAEALGISRRMVAYYEGESSYAPTGLLPTMAKLFGVSVDDLLGSKGKRVEPPRPRDTRLLRRLQRIEKLPPRERRQIVEFIDALLERDELRNEADG